MALMVRRTELAVELATQATAKQRQASKPGKKGGAGMAAIPADDELMRDPPPGDPQRQRTGREDQSALGARPRASNRVLHLSNQDTSLARVAQVQLHQFRVDGAIRP